MFELFIDAQPKKGKIASKSFFEHVNILKRKNFFSPKLLLFQTWKFYRWLLGAGMRSFNLLGKFTQLFFSFFFFFFHKISCFQTVTVSV